MAFLKVNESLTVPGDSWCIGLNSSRSSYKSEFNPTGHRRYPKPFGNPNCFMEPLKMVQNHSFFQRTTGEDSATEEEIREPPRFRTRQVIIENFERTRSLNVVQNHDTILSKPGDDDKGATPFIQLIRKLIGNRGRSVDPFEAKWLVSDSAQLQHVIRTTKIRERGLFNALNAHATVVVVNKFSESYEMLTSLRHELHVEDCKTITAFPSRIGNGYDFYGNFEPLDDHDWSEGPLCTLLDNASSVLNELLVKLHSAHVKRMTGESRSMPEHSENKEFSILSLEDLIA